jgi:translation initiation factor IF-1
MKKSYLTFYKKYDIIYIEKEKIVKQAILVEGLITEILPSDKFRVQLDNGFEIIAYLGGKMRLNKIRMVTGDRVELELSQYDLTQGRIVYRY